MIPAEAKKDMFILFMVTATGCLYSTWPLIYPYVASYNKHYEPELTFKSFFSGFPLIFVGMFFANSMAPKLFFILGVRKTIQLASILYFINCITFCSITGLFPYFANIIFMGMNWQLFVFASNYFLSKKYENGVYYYSYISIGSTTGTFIWPFVLREIVNPGNRSMDAKTNINGYDEYYYDHSVSSKIITYFTIHGAIVMLTNLISCQYLRNPEGCRGIFTNWISSMLTKDKESIQQLQNEYQEFSVENESILSLSFMDSMHSDDRKPEKEHELIEKNREVTLQNKDSEQEENKEATVAKNKAEVKEIMFSIKFISLIYISAIKSASLLYFMNNYKYIATFIVRDDDLISTVYSISSIAGIVGRLSVAKIWKHYNFLGAYLINLIGPLFINILFITVSYANPAVFLIEAIIGRMFLSYSYTMNTMTIFKLYGVEKGVYLVKVYDTCMIFAFVYAVIVNWLCAYDDDFRSVFLVFIVFEISAIYLLLKIFSNNR